MNTMKKSLLGACAVFMCVGVADADVWENGILIELSDEAVARLEAINAQLVGSGNSVSEADFIAEVNSLGWSEIGTFDMNDDSTGITFDLSDDAIAAGIAVESAIDSASSAVSTVVEEVKTSLQIAQDILDTGLIEEITQSAFDTAQLTVDAGLIDPVTEGEVATAQTILDNGLITPAVTQIEIDAAALKMVTGLRVAVTLTDISTNTFFVEKIEGIIETGFIEADALAAFTVSDIDVVDKTNQDVIDTATTTINTSVVPQDVSGAKATIAGTVADIIEADADSVSDALTVLSTTVTTASETAATATAAWNITVGAVGTAQDVVGTAQDAATDTGMLIGNVDSLVDANAYLTTLSDVDERDLVQDVITAFEDQADAVEDQMNAQSVNNDALNALINAQAAVADAVIASMETSSDNSITAAVKTAQAIMDKGVLSGITGGDLVSAWKTTVLGVRTQITQEQVNEAQAIVDTGFTVQNSSFSLPGVTPVSPELYEYAKTVVRYTEESLFDDDGYAQSDITEAQAIVDAGVLEEITTTQHAVATAVLLIETLPSIEEARALLKDGLIDDVTQGDLNDAQQVVDATEIIAAVEVVGATATSRDAVTRTEIDKNIELLSLLTYAEEEFNKPGAIVFSDKQIDLETMQAIIKLAEAQILVDAGVTLGVTQDDLDRAQAIIDASTEMIQAQAIVDAGVTAEVTQDDLDRAQAIVDAGEMTPEQVDAVNTVANAGEAGIVTQEQINEARVALAAGKTGAVTQEQIDEVQNVLTKRILTAQVLVNNGVKNENPTAEQIEAALAKRVEYETKYTIEVVQDIVDIYAIDGNDVDAFMVGTNSSSDKDVAHDKKFVSHGGIDSIKALVNTSNVETALSVMLKMDTDSMTLNDFITKSKPDTSSSVSGSTAGVNVVGGAIGGHQQSVVASSGKYGLKRHSLSVSKQLGMSSGDASKNTGAWLKIFGSDSEMDMRDSVPGYDADASGIVVGIDKTFGDMTIGAAISVANIDVDGKSIANSKTDSDQYQGTLYGTMMMESYYINGSLALARSSSDTSRNGLDGVVTGSYDTDIFAASLGIGIPVDMGSVAIIPQATMSYASISPDGYTESGVGALRVNAENLESFGIKAGVAVISTFAFGNGVMAPQVRLMADWDVTQEQAVVNSSWVGDVDNTVYTTSGAKPASLGAILGAGFDYASDDGLYVLSLGYDLGTKSDFVSHTGSAKFRVNF